MQTTGPGSRFLAHNRPMQRRHFTLALVATTALAACSRQADAPAQPPIDKAQALDTLTAQGKGFSVGALMAKHSVYVLFDPQCPHCAHLWEASQPLLPRARFVWLPVSLLNAKSLPQGAAILGAANPTETMAAHEKSLIAGQGGMAASSSIPADIEAAIKTNTVLLERLGATSVPYIVAQHARTGETITHAGAMDTAALTQLLGL